MLIAAWGGLAFWMKIGHRIFGVCRERFESIALAKKIRAKMGLVSKESHSSVHVQL